MEDFMPFILLISGLLLIYLALRKGRNEKTNKNSSNSYDSEIKSLRDDINSLNNKLDKLENTVMVLNEDLGKIPDTGFEREISAKKNNTEEFDNMVDKNENKLKNDLNTKIYELYDKGKSIDEICSNLSTGKGEVLLRLGLRNQKK
jgi:predicted  nucleic acid-binding Zn-ribbon protein